MSYAEAMHLSWKMRIVMGAGVVVFIGLSMFLMGLRQYVRSFYVGDEPAVVTAYDLNKEGPGDNLYVQVTQCRIPEIYESDSGTYYVPAVASARVLIVGRATDPMDASMAMTTGVMEGVMDGRGSTLSADVRKELKSHFSDTRFENVRVIDINSDPGSLMKLSWSFVVGGLITLVGIGLVFAAMKFVTDAD